jgi:sulfite exporter TauE/SafE
MGWEWVTAILAASLLGSGHCVGMCGPFAVLATGQSAAEPWAKRWGTLASYHAGRWMTYLLLGAIMGGLGSVADGLAISAGWAPIAARLVGGLMIVMGLMLIVRWWRGSSGVTVHSGWAARWNQMLIAIRKRWRARTAAGAAFSWGLISTWLPCGWLYVFAIAAAGAGGVAWGMVLMTAFWIGTLPLLSLVPVGAWLIAGPADANASLEGQVSAPTMASWISRLRALVTSVQPLVQPIAAGLLVAFGIFTATSRAEISLVNLRTSTSERWRGSVQDQLREVIDQELPCCVDSERSEGGAAHEPGDGE